MNSNNFLLMVNTTSSTTTSTTSTTFPWGFSHCFLIRWPLWIYQNEGSFGISKTRLSDFIAAWPWASHFTTLDFSFLIYTVGFWEKLVMTYRSTWARSVPHVETNSGSRSQCGQTSEYAMLISLWRASNVTFIWRRLTVVISPCKFGVPRWARLIEAYIKQKYGLPSDLGHCIW